MSDSTQQRPNLPVAGAKFDPRGYYLGLTFHPAIRLDRKKGLEFAATLSDYIDPRNVELGEEKWRFSQPMPGGERSQFSVLVLPARIQIAAEFPTLASEWFEERQHMILQKFGESFRPELVLSTAAMVRGTIAIDGDARVFLAEHVMCIDPVRVSPLERPIHLVGLHLAFPPFQRTTAGGVERDESVLDVKAESLSEDPKKLFLEVDGRWLRPQAWKQENVEKAIQHLSTVRGYLERNLLGFLTAGGGGQLEGQGND